MIKYKAIWFATPKIEKVEIGRETANNVVLLSGRREAKCSDNHSYSNTYSEAKDWILQKCLNDKKKREEDISRFKSYIDELNSYYMDIDKWEEE